MIDRRHFVKLSAGAAVGGLLGLEPIGFTPQAAAESRSLDRIGVQLYTVRSLLEKDFEGTVEAVAAIGYDEVEFHDYFGRTPRQVRDLLDRVGLEAPAAHYPWDGFRDDPDKLIETAVAVGHRYVILAWMPPEARSTIVQYQELATMLNELGDACEKAGTHFAYHNHDFEFAPIDGKVPFDLLLDETDPALVKFELDLFWTVKAGHNPLDYFASYPDRFTLCHVKDMAEGGEMVDVGDGELDFAAIFRQSEQAGLKYYFVEHDGPADPMASIETSYKYLKALQF